MAHRTLMAGLAIALVVGVGLSAPATAASPNPATVAGYPGGGGGGSAGSPSGGDPLFLSAGNGGYDVRHYHLDLSWQPSVNTPVDGGTLTGSELIFATTTQALSSFNLDLRTLSVSEVRVNGRIAASVSDGGQELTITPDRVLPKRSPFVVQIKYSGTPQFTIDPDGSPDGWIPTTTPDGKADGVFVAGEPQGAPTWFAVNDIPNDKATYDISMTVPDGLTAIGNGSLGSAEQGRQDHVQLVRAVSDVVLSGHHHHREVRRHQGPHPEGCAHLHRRRSGRGR